MDYLLLQGPLLSGEAVRLLKGAPEKGQSGLFCLRPLPLPPSLSEPRQDAQGSAALLCEERRPVCVLSFVYLLVSCWFFLVI